MAGITVAHMQSDKNPGKYYDIVEGNDGVTYCTCMAWKMKKTCKHLDRYYATLRIGGTFETPKPNPNVVHISSPLDEVISAEVSKLLSR